MPDFHLALTLKTAFLFVAIPAAIAFAAWSYRYTIPPISTTLKAFLVTLRSLALIFIFLLLGQPLLTLLMHSVEEPIVAILIDNSKSMSIHDRSGNRKEILTKLLQSPAFSKLRTFGLPVNILFDRSSKTISSFSPESLTVNGDGTDIGAALKRLQETATSTNVQAAVLLSDGEYTVGTSPIYESEELGLPVYTIGIGDSSDQKDVQVRRVLANDITYVGNKVPVNTTIRSTGFDGERVEVTLGQNGTVVDRKVLALEPGTREYAVPLSFVPAKDGMQKFTVAVSKLAGELTEQNNTMNFYTKVLKSKMKVVLVAGSPSEDVAFIGRALEGDKNVELQSYVEQKNGSFYGKPLTSQAIGDADCLILIDYPNDVTSASSLALIREAVDGTKPFLFVLSRTLNFQKLSALEAALPFAVGATSGNEFQVFVAISDAHRNNPLLRLSMGGTDAWAKLAPIFRTQSVFQAKPGSEVLGTTRIQSITTQDPVFVSRNVNRKKSFAVLAYGFWRWKMFGDPASQTENLLDEFLSNTVRWLTTREDDRRFRVQPVKSAFSGQDPIEFTGQLYDENYKPTDDATVQVTVTRGGETNDIVLNSLGNGQYDGLLDQLGEGDYSYTAKAQRGGKVVGDDKGTFSVGGLNVEFLDTRMNKLFLQQIADRTGGKYFDANAIESLPNDIASLPNFKPRELTHTREIELWNYRWMLALIVLLLVVEWFTRKRNGMI